MRHRAQGSRELPRRSTARCRSPPRLRDLRRNDLRELAPMPFEPLSVHEKGRSTVDSRFSTSGDVFEDALAEGALAQRRLYRIPVQLQPLRRREQIVTGEFLSPGE